MLLRVVVPPGSSPGEELELVPHDGRHVRVTIPAGLAPGQVFHAALPVDGAGAGAAGAAASLPHRQASEPRQGPPTPPARAALPAPTHAPSADGSSGRVRLGTSACACLAFFFLFISSLWVASMSVLFWTMLILGGVSAFCFFACLRSGYVDGDSAERATAGAESGDSATLALGIVNKRGRRSIRAARWRRRVVAAFCAVLLVVIGLALLGAGYFTRVWLIVAHAAYCAPLLVGVLLASLWRPLAVLERGHLQQPAGISGDSAAAWRARMSSSTTTTTSISLRDRNIVDAGVGSRGGDAAAATRASDAEAPPPAGWLPLHVHPANRAANTAPAARKPHRASSLQPYRGGHAVAKYVVVSTEVALGALGALDTATDEGSALDMGALEKRAKRGVVRMLLPKGDAFAMLSYTSALKRSRNGRAMLRGALEHMRARGFDLVWWDWLIVDEGEGRPYVQAEFESAMQWAAEYAARVFVAWPTSAGARYYLSRPWCVAELAAAVRRDAHEVLLWEEPGAYASGGRVGGRTFFGGLACAMLVGFVYVSLVASAFLDARGPPTYDVASRRTALSDEHRNERALRVWLGSWIAYQIACFVIFVGAMGVVRALRADGDFALYAEEYPMDMLLLLQHMTAGAHRVPPHSSPEASGAAVRGGAPGGAAVPSSVARGNGTVPGAAAAAPSSQGEVTARHLRRFGHLRGSMFDVGDAPTCAKVLGIRAAAPFTFDQCLLAYTRAALSAGLTANGVADALALRLGSMTSIPHRSIDDFGSARWLRGWDAAGPVGGARAEAAAAAAASSVAALSPDYVAPLSLCLSSRAGDGVVLRRVLCSGPTLRRWLVLYACAMLLVAAMPLVGFVSDVLVVPGRWLRAALALRWFGGSFAVYLLLTAPPLGAVLRGTLTFTGTSPSLMQHELLTVLAVQACTQALILTALIGWFAAYIRARLAFPLMIAAVVVPSTGVVIGVVVVVVSVLSSTRRPGSAAAAVPFGHHGWLGTAYDTPIRLVTNVWLWLFFPVSAALLRCVHSRRVL